MACETVALVSSCQALPWMMEVVPWLRYWRTRFQTLMTSPQVVVDFVAADFVEAIEDLHFRAERGDDDDVFLGEAVKVVDAARFLELLDAHDLELVVDLGVVDDFAEKIDVVPGENLGGGVGHVDGALDAVAEAEGLGELDGEAVGREVRFGVAKIVHHRAAVVAFHLGLDEFHDLRGAEVDFSGGVDRDGHGSSNRDRGVSVKYCVGGGAR